MLMKKRTSSKLILLSILSLISVASVVFTILVFTKYSFHSDCMGFLLQAKEQVKQHRYFPEGFHYTTGIFGFTTSVYMIPFVNFIQNDFLLHEMGSIIAFLVVIGLNWVLFWNDKKIATLSTIMICYPLGSIYRDMMFYQSAYTNSFTLILLNLLIVKKLIQEKKIEKKYRVYLFIYLVVCIFTNYYGVSNYIYVEAPLILSIILKCWIDNGLDVKKIVQNEKKYLLILAVTLVGMVIGLIIFKGLCYKLDFNVEIKSGGIINPNNMLENWNYTLASMFVMFGIDGTSSLFSFNSIAQCLLIIYLFMSVIIVPIYFCKNLEKVKGEFNRLLVIYGIIENFVMLFLMFFGGMIEARYFIPALLTNNYMLIIFAEIISEEQKDKVKNLPIYFVIIVSIINNMSFYMGEREVLSKTDFQQIMHPSIHSDLIDFLREQGLDYGYATFWNSYNNMVISNSDITIVPFDQNNPLVPYYFNINSVDNINYYACSEDLYNPKLHQGKCFVLLRDGESIREEYYELADETLWCDGYTILVYNQNLNNYEQLVETLYN